MKPKYKIEKRLRRKRRVRAKIKGTESRPRLSVFRSNKHLFVQLIDDSRGKTLVSVSDMEVKNAAGNEPKKKTAFGVGENLAKKALVKKIKKVIFDKGGYKYHGRIKEVADGARKGGLEF